MTCQLIFSTLTDEQKGQIYGILSVGCDRQTAANFVGCSLAAIRQTMQRDPAFADGVCRAEAGAELNHMRNVQQAAKDEKHWRASVWWLERRAPERYGPRGPGAIQSRQLKAFIEILSGILCDEVRDAAERQRILDRLNALAASARQMLLDSQWDLSDGANAADAAAEAIAGEQRTDSPPADQAGLEDDTP
jgi:hypothetical protein